MDKNHYGGIDLGGTNIKIAISDRQGNFLSENAIPTDSYEGPEQVLRRIGDETLRLADEAGVRLSAIGMAAPGTLDMRSGVIKYLANFPGHWPDVPVREILEKRAGCPIHVINDVRAATLGELDFGRGREVSSMVFLALGTGIGGGVVIDKKLRLGRIGSAGELGHMMVQPFGRPCGCGARGCLETVLSGPALTGEAVRLFLAGQAPRLHEIVKGNLLEVNTETMAAAARAGDKPIQVAIERAAWYLGFAMANLMVALHPEMFVIGGGVAGLGDLLLDPLRRAVRENVRMFPVDDVRIEPSALGNRAGVLGAATLAMRGGFAKGEGELRIEN